tara:strand:+ start:247 stop:498 length:252 start_codon:yes stop_codon:yes gene_type:complete
MTYKELLFKMADKGMLTLSADKDGRGLFWAGMDNLEALEQPFDLADFPRNYPKKEVEQKESKLSPTPYKDKQGRIIAPFNKIK